MTTEDPPCISCAGPTERSYFPIAAIWTKAMGDYADPKSENYYQQKQAGGHTALEVHPDTGEVSKVWIDSPQKNSDYCRRNGLIDPKNIASNLQVAANGTSYETVNKSEI